MFNNKLGKTKIIPLNNIIYHPTVPSPPHALKFLIINFIFLYYYSLNLPSIFKSFLFLCFSRLVLGLSLVKSKTFLLFK